MYLLFQIIMVCVVISIIYMLLWTDRKETYKTITLFAILMIALFAYFAISFPVDLDFESDFVTLYTDDDRFYVMGDQLEVLETIINDLSIKNYRTVHRFESRDLLIRLWGPNQGDATFHFNGTKGYCTLNDQPYKFTISEENLQKIKDIQTAYNQASKMSKPIPGLRTELVLIKEEGNFTDYALKVYDTELEIKIYQVELYYKNIDGSSRSIHQSDHLNDGEIFTTTFRVDKTRKDYKRREIIVKGEQHIEGQWVPVQTKISF